MTNVLIERLSGGVTRVTFVGANGASRDYGRIYRDGDTWSWSRGSISGAVRSLAFSSRSAAIGAIIEIIEGEQGA